MPENLIAGKVTESTHQISYIISASDPKKMRGISYAKQISGAWYAFGYSYWHIVHNWQDPQIIGELPKS